MVWFYTRGRDSLRLETRYDNGTLEYVAILTHADRRRETTRFATLEEFRAWVVAVERDLTTADWVLDGAPHILSDGWPDKRPSH